MEIYQKQNMPWRIIDDAALVVNPKTSLIYPLNATACRIWQLIDGRNTIDNIIEIIHSEFEISIEDLRSDILDFIIQLKEAGLIKKI